MLLQKSFAVRILSRTTPPGSLFPETVEYFQGDICNPEAVNRALEGIDIVHHLAAKLPVANPSNDLRQAYRRINVDGTRHLVNAARSLGILRFVFASTIAVYGPGCDMEVVDETSPLNPQSLYAVSKCEAEKIVLEARKRDDNQPLGTVLRLATVYGPRMRGNYASLVSAVRCRRFIPIGTGQNRRTLVYDRDAARAAVLAASHPKAAGQVFNVTDGRIYPLRAILAAIYEAGGRRRPKFYLPAKPARLAVGLAEFGMNLIGVDSRIQRTHVDKLTEDIAVSGKKIQDQLGYQPRYDLQQGWQETVHNLKNA
jgi:UDP-glucose 4-epimerase